MLFSKQIRYCPNCGTKLHDDKMDMRNVKSQMCSVECINEWELKYARMILGRE